ncbi:hypothetical protein K458DRAFT_191393 [Lentithecium fluviatile CBS 122367]|uniref:Uncharacterized protein n=1 Tax=Lentithecium fluviatile CBS 122367 TaxID=1168545 RepID=A0A6G1JAD3_9PLEO|nr:hypothetical protein K458DRAFT_191393 [Lentithecium fluviatile CBS 122367]
MTSPSRHTPMLTHRHCNPMLPTSHTRDTRTYSSAPQIGGFANACDANPPSKKRREPETRKRLCRSCMLRVAIADWAVRLFLFAAMMDNGRSGFVFGHPGGGVMAEAYGTEMTFESSLVPVYILSVLRCVMH